MREVLPQSLIILKNSIIEGRVPTSENLEVGELALGLFKGQESIWSKNSSGEVVNLRSPRHDLMWGDLFKKYNTKNEFERELSLSLIKDTSVIFIEETKQIWTGGIFYNTELTWEDIEGFILSYAVVFPESITNLIENYTENFDYHNEINQIFKGKLNFIRLIRNLKRKPYTLSLSLPGGTIPLNSRSSEDSEKKEYILYIDYYYDGMYNKIIIKLKDDIFSITRDSIDISKISKGFSEITERLDIIEGGEEGITAVNIKWTDVIE